MNNAFPRTDPPKYFSLRRQGTGEALLPIDQQLVIDPLHDMALLVDWQKRRLIAACTFFDEELLLLLPILRAWPGYVSYGRLLALLAAGRIPEPEQEAAIDQRYREALVTGTEGSLLAPLRARLAEPQRKLATFGLKLVSVYQNGILLSAASITNQKERE